MRTAAANPGVVALRRMVADGADRWEETTYRELRDQVAAVAAGLQAVGLPGQWMGLMMRNRPEFHVVDLAATFLRATLVSIYNSSAAEELQYLVDHAEAEIAVVEDIGFLERFLKVRVELPRLRRIFVIDLPSDDTPDDVAPYEVVLSSGRADLEVLAEATDPDDLATLIYTSGTTGPPKGVMISQHNVVQVTIVVDLVRLERCHCQDAGHPIVTPAAAPRELMTPCQSDGGRCWIPGVAERLTVEPGGGGAVDGVDASVSGSNVGLHRALWNCGDKRNRRRPGGSARSRRPPRG